MLYSLNIAVLLQRNIIHVKSAEYADGVLIQRSSILQIVCPNISLAVFLRCIMAAHTPRMSNMMVNYYVHLIKD